MRESARVESIEALAAFRGSLCKFSDVVEIGLQEAESEIQRTNSWLKNEQLSFWKDQIRKRAEIVLQTKHDLNRKKLYKTPTGGRYSTVDEEKALKVAKMRHEEAEQKLRNVHRWIGRLAKEVILYQGQVNALRQAAGVGVPKAVAHLDRLVGSLEAYVSLAAPVGGRPAGDDSGAGIGVGDQAPSMARDVQDSEFDWTKEHERLRKLAPSRSVLDAAPLQEARFRWIDGSEIDLPRRKAIAALGSQSASFGGDDKVVLAKDVWASSRVFLERVAAPSEGDTGWFIGPANCATTQACLSVRVDDLLQARPDFLEILELPKGFLVVLNSGSIEAVFDDRGNLVLHGSAAAPVRSTASE